MVRSCDAEAEIGNPRPAPLSVKGVEAQKSERVPRVKWTSMREELGRTAAREDIRAARTPGNPGA